jgi:hypothetical protein
MHADGKQFDLRAGSMLTVDQAIPYDLQAVEDSSYLLTVAWPDA